MTSLEGTQADTISNGNGQRMPSWNAHRRLRNTIEDLESYIVEMNWALEERIKMLERQVKHLELQNEKTASHTEFAQLKKQVDRHDFHINRFKDQQ